ncbi:Kynurenine 3-monooxygenase [Aphelenchoides bicaudatus]|nr:Kynurenine 3-monooxygenase [Aphelenchoides bicaudatus]
MKKRTLKQVLKAPFRRLANIKQRVSLWTQDRKAHLRVYNDDFIKDIPPLYVTRILMDDEINLDTDEDRGFIETDVKKITELGGAPSQAEIMTSADWDDFVPRSRQMEHVPGRSINLALSERGKSALKAAGVSGLQNYVAEQGVKLHARLIHDPDGKTKHWQPYGQPGQHIVSINRRHLNEAMITESEKFPNVTFFFEHKITQTTYLKALEKDEEELVPVTGDLLLACDGAFSAVRRSLMGYPRFDFSQEYIEHGYVELNILPTKTAEFALEPNGFHLWPRGDFTLIALANMDKTFTVTLFAPFKVFEQEMFDSCSQLAFFRRNFPDALDLLGEQHVIEVFQRMGPTPSALVSVKCNPHGFEDFLILMGDAAHAMVPFYGQGMNAGFEDCLILSETLNKFNEDIPTVVREYSKKRWVDAHTINDLAMYNYQELKDLVNKIPYKLRKKLDLFLNRLFPKSWIPLYSMVTFTRTPYRDIVAERKHQDKVLRQVGQLIGLSIAAGVLYAGVRNFDRIQSQVNRILH